VIKSYNESQIWEELKESWKEVKQKQGKNQQNMNKWLNCQ